MAFPDSGLQAYWKLNETSGTRMDETSNNNDLTDNNTVLYGTGKLDNAADFESTNSEYLSIADASQTGLDMANDMSFSFWVNLETATDGTPRALFAKTGTAGYYCQHYIWTSKKIVFTWSDGGGSNQATCATDLGTGAWHHVVITVSRAAGGSGILFYIDGSSVTAGDVSGSRTGDGSNTDPFIIGANNGPSQYFDGMIDEFGVWNRVLTSGEVTTLYNGGAGLTYPEVSTTSAGKLLLMGCGM